MTERCSEPSLYPQFKFFQVLPDGKNYLIAGDTILKENLFPYAMQKWGHKLSTKAKSYLEEINTLASDESISAENTIIEYNRIKNSVIKDNQVTLREKDYIVMVLQIAIGSTDYWDKNLGKWNNLFSQYSPLRCCGVSGKKAAKADISGAVGGGVAGAIVGGSVSFGVLTVPGWAVGAVSGAVGASVTSVVDDLLDYFWK